MEDGQFRRDNHYVPRGYLKAWATERRVWTYSLLVSHPNYPLWKLRSTRGLARHDHLYTQMVAGKESDRLERRLAEEFENPAMDALHKATSDARLSPGDWKHLVRFLAAQDVRTPAWFTERMKNWTSTLADQMKDITSQAVGDYSAGLRNSPSARTARATDMKELPIRVRVDRERGGVEVAALAGRQMWAWAMERSLENTIRALYQHRWTILAAPRETAWITSDNPVVRLNFVSPSSYTFGGGWGSPGTEIIFPLGPRHLMYTEIGSRPPRRGEEVPVIQAQWIRRFIAEHAYRLILANREDPEVQDLRRRREDPDEYERETLVWKRWHADQVEAERNFQS